MKLIFILGMAALSLVSFRLAAEGACAYGEMSVFDCELGNAKASLCMSSETGLPGYRNVSMRGKFFSISEKKHSEKLIFFISNVPYAGGYETHIRFDNRNYTYFIYHRSIKTDDGPISSAGIVVYRGQERIASDVCQNDSSIRALAYDRLPREDYRDIDVDQIVNKVPRKNKRDIIP